MIAGRVSAISRRSAPRERHNDNSIPSRESRSNGSASHSNPASRSFSPNGPGGETHRTPQPASRAEAINADRKLYRYHSVLAKNKIFLGFTGIQTRQVWHQVLHFANGKGIPNPDFYTLDEES